MILRKQLKRINCLFAQKVYSNFQSERYGLKSCQISPQRLDYLQDLKYLIEYLSADYDTDNPSLIGSCCDTPLLIENIDGTF